MWVAIGAGMMIVVLSGFFLFIFGLFFTHKDAKPDEYMEGITKSLKNIDGTQKEMSATLKKMNKNLREINNKIKID